MQELGSQFLQDYARLRKPLETYTTTPRVSVILNRFPIVLGVDGPITISPGLNLCDFLPLWL